MALQTSSTIKNCCWCIARGTRPEGTSEPISASFLILNPTCPTNPHLTKMNQSVQLHWTLLTLTQRQRGGQLSLTSSRLLSCFCNKTQKWNGVASLHLCCRRYVFYYTLIIQKNLILRYKSEEWKCGIIPRLKQSVQSFKKRQYFKNWKLNCEAVCPIVETVCTAFIHNVMLMIIDYSASVPRRSSSNRINKHMNKMSANKMRV